MKSLFSVILLSLLFLSGCSGGTSSNIDSNENKSYLKFAGLFKSYEHGTKGITLNLTLNNENVIGTYSTTLGGKGNVTGTLTSTNTQLTLTQTNGCAGTFYILGTVSINELNQTDIISSFTGGDCIGVYSSGQSRVVSVTNANTAIAQSGNYFGMNLDTGYIMSISTENGIDYNGTVNVMYDISSTFQANTTGKLNGLEGLSLTNFKYDGVNTNYTSGAVKVNSIDTSIYGETVLKTAWSLSYYSGSSGTGAIYMYPIN